MVRALGVRQTGLSEVVPRIDHRALVEAWLAALGDLVRTGERASSTITAYRRWIRQWLAHLESTNAAPTPATVVDFVAAYRLEHRPATVNAILQAIRSLYAWAEAMNLYPAIARSVRGPRVDRDGPLPVIPLDQLAAAAAAAGTYDPPRRRLSTHEERLRVLAQRRDEAVLRVLFATGVRLVSLVRANLADVHLEEPQPYLDHQPKGQRSKAARAPLPPAAAGVLRDYLAMRSEMGLVSDALWIGLRPHAGSRIDVRSMRRIVTSAFQRVGLVLRDIDGHIDRPGIFTPHGIRRTAITHVVDHDGLEAGQILGGHASSDTTRRSYARVHALRVLDRASRLLDLPEPRATDGVR